MFPFRCVVQTSIGPTAPKASGGVFTNSEGCVDRCDPDANPMKLEIGSRAAGDDEIHYTMRSAPSARPKTENSGAFGTGSSGIFLHLTCMHKPVHVLLIDWLFTKSIRQQQNGVDVYQTHVHLQTHHTILWYLVSGMETPSTAAMPAAASFHNAEESDTQHTQ